MQWDVGTMLDGYSKKTSLYNYLSRFKQDEPVYLVNIKLELLNLLNIDIPINILENYFIEKGYTNIHLKEFKKGRKTDNLQNVAEFELTEQLNLERVVEEDENDEDFDPNIFIKMNKEKINNIVLVSSNYKDNTWLAEKYQKEHKIEILNELLIKNRGLVESVASRYSKHANNKLDYDDLVSEGFLGLMKAADRFDTSLGYQFSTYATWWIRQTISRAIVDKGYNIRIPVYMYESINKVLKFERKSILIFNEVDKKWVANQLDITLDKYNELKKIDHMFLHLASLDIVVSEEDNDTSLLDFLEYKPLIGLGIEGEQFENPEALVLKKELITLLEECMSELKERESEVLKLRFGWNGSESKTLEEIGVFYKVTRERIRQIEAKALIKVRNKLRKKNFGYL